MHDKGLGAVVVGTSIGVLLHVPGLRAARIRVEALVGRDRSRARDRAELLGIPHACGSLEEALSLPAVDIVVVATPPAAHAPLVLEAVAAGKHVMCEKPFGLNLAEARTMCQEAQRAGIVHVLGTEFGFDSAQALLRRVVQAGDIGTPAYAMILLHMGALAGADAEMPAWFDRAELGGGWLRGAGSHAIDLVRSTLGDIATVAGSVQQLGLRPRVTSDDSFTMTFTLESGAEGLIQSSAGAFGPPLLATKIVGTAGAAWIDPLTRTVMIDVGDGSQEIPFPSDLISPPPVPPPPDLITTTYDQWHATGNEVITSGRMYGALRSRILGEDRTSPELLPTFADGVALQAVITALEAASAEHRTVALSELDRR